MSNENQTLPETGNRQREQPAEQPLTALQSIVKGSIQGANEVGVNHPLFTIKTRIQNEAKFTLNPRILYRGISLNAASMVPITAIQVCMTNMLLKSSHSLPILKDSLYLNDERRKLGAAFIGGMTSAVVGTPTELIMARMDQTKQSFRLVVKNLYQSYGALRFMRGLPGTGIRDGIFTIGFTVLPTLVEKQMKCYLPSQGEKQQKLISYTSGPIAGVIAAVASHPFDTIKTRQQKMISEKNASFWETGRKLVQEKGFFALYKGVIPRGTRVVSAISLMNLAGKSVEGWVREKCSR